MPVTIVKDVTLENVGASISAMDFESSGTAVSETEGFSETGGIDRVARIQAEKTKASWFQGMSLHERLELSLKVGVSDDSRLRDHLNWKLAEARLKEWRSQTPFEKDEWWLKRWEWLGLEEKDLLEFLAETPEALVGRVNALPSWLSDALLLEEEYREFGADSDGALHARLEKGGWFAPILLPYVQPAFERVLQHAQRLQERHPEKLFDSADATDLFFKELPPRLDLILGRTLVLEMYVAGAQGELQGETPEKRFENFIDGMKDEGRLAALFAEYPVLARLTIQAIEQWVEVTSELLTRLAEDGPAIVEQFFAGENPGRLIDVSGGLGDLHKNGRSVRMLHFESGAKLVYKPRSLAIDARFSELLTWLNERRDLDLRAVRVLNRGTHGWAEHVVNQACSEDVEVERFYRRQGNFLALLYALGANDMHRENLVAVGEHPVLIDLETLFSPDFGRSNPDNYESAAEHALENSLMRIMLLPYFNRGADADLVESSGLGGAEGQEAVHDSLVWEHPGTDQMRLVRRKGQLGESFNRPTVRGQAVDPLSFVEPLEHGFVEMYRWLRNHREQLLAEDSPLMAFRSVEVRSVLRASQFYAFILRESYHPDLMRDALDRDRHFDRMWFGIDRSRLVERSRRVIPAEQRDLWRGDLPYFSTRVDSRDVWTSDGERLVEYFSHSGFEILEENLRRLSEEDLAEQRWYLRGSLTALTMSVTPSWGRYEFPPEPKKPVDSEILRAKLLDRAVKVGERLAETAKVSSELDTSWMGLAWTNNRGWWLRPLDYDLYSGLPGIALCLAQLGIQTGRQDFTQLAEGAMRTVDRKLERHPTRVRYIGGFDGWGGLIHAWTHLATLWRRDDLLESALRRLPDLAAKIDHDVHLDVVRGSAGAIVPLLNLHRQTGVEAPFELAKRLGDRLVDLSQPFDGGRAWLMAAAPTRPLTGFSHGAAGAAWALNELFAATGDERYRSLALDAVAFENAYFSAKHSGWADLRVPPGQEKETPSSFMNAWCHGTTGIGLSRMRMLRQGNETHLRHDAEIAVQRVSTSAFGSNHCICHGDFGGLDLMLEASLAWPESTWSEQLAKRTAQVLQGIEEQGFLCGIPLKVESPGLMDGLAGIGYTLLRLADPTKIPSILLLDPPTGS